MATLEKELLHCEQCGAPMESSSSALGCLNCLLLGGSNAVDTRDRRYQHYEVCLREDGTLDELGRGAMGITYYALDVNLGSAVALKVISGGFANQPEARERFRREAQSAAQLRHPNVASVFHFGETTTGQCFYAMELIEGETLETRVRRDGPLPAALALDIATQVARALMAAKSHQLVHRDLNPSNLMIVANDPSGADFLIVKVIDFGLAKAVAALQSASDLYAGFSGTPDFASPEQFNAAERVLDARSDIYSLGATLWYLLCGRAPFPGRSPAQPHQQQPPEPLPREQLVAAKVPAPVVALLRSMLAVDPADRPQSARELLAALRRCRKSMAATPRHRRMLELAAFAVAFWLLIQIAIQVLPYFDIPLWAVRLVVTLLILAFPVALISWGFDFTPKGFIRPSEAIPAAPLGFGPRSKPNRVIESLAVLPLANETADATLEYLSDGISEGIINILSQLPSLRVMASSTVFRYKGRNIDARHAGDALKVDAVLSGLLLRRENQFMIKAELLNVADGTQIWGQRYIINKADVFSAEEIISKEIAEKLRIRLTETQRHRVERQNTDNPIAYRLYLQGRYQWNRRTEEGLRKAIEHFQEAIENDPGYARAWAGLADSYTVLGCWGYDAPHQCYPKAKAAAERALELDDSVAEAHTSLAVAKKDYYWDWAGAEEEYLRALELNPNSGITRQWYGEYLACVGKHAESILELQQAQQLDPLSPMLAASVGRYGYYFAREFDRACTQLQEIVRSEPQFWIGHMFLGWVYVAKGRWPQALAQFTAARRLDDNPETLVGIGYASALSGEQIAARRIVDKLKALRTERYVQSVHIALVDAALGEKEEALVWLEKAFEEHAQWLSEIKVDPAFDPLRGGARFNQLLQRMGLA